MRLRPRFLTLTAATLAHASGASAMVMSALPDKGAAGVALFAVAVSGACLVLAWLIATRVPTSPVPGALAAMAAFATVVPAVEAWGLSFSSEEPWIGAEFTAPLVRAIWPLQLIGFGLLLLTFPAAPLRRPGAVRAMALGLAGILLILVGNWGTSADSDFSGWRVPVVAAGLIGLAGVLVLAAAGLVQRTRQAGPAGHRQARWLLLASGVVGLLMAVSWLTVPDLVPPEVGYGAFLMALYVFVPAAVAVAVIRHDLLDIDRLVSDSVAVIITSAVAAMAWAGSVVLVQAMVRDAADLETGAAAFVTAIVLVPAYRWIRKWSAATFDRERTVVLGSIRQFARDVHAGVRQPEDVEAALRRILRDPGLKIGLTQTNGVVDLSGAPADLRRDVVLRAGSAEIGVLQLGLVSSRRRRLAQEAVRICWSALESCRLRAGLRAALEEVDASRNRIELAASMERRRLERDLHDGAQQSLVAIGMRLRSVQSALRPGSSAHEDVEVVVAQLAETVVELRRISQGIRPARLDDGLGPALEALRAATPIPLTLTIDEAADHEGFDEAVAQAAYFVVAEAVANALKHAHASAIAVSVERRNGRAVVRICDDGIGGVDPIQALRALQDRVGSLGGSLALDSPAGGGTLVEAVL